MSKSGSKENVSKVLQDTFNELQAQLVQQRSRTPNSDLEVSPETDLKSVVAGLAKREGFEVLDILGMGGMGAVVRARDMKLNRTVALKFLPPELVSKSNTAMALRKEAELASRIQHENVVSILSWHEVDNVPFFAMEFIQGETVDDLVRRRGRLQPQEALRISAEAARGVEALHQSDIIHRDIKPQNILISQEGRVKITDFGISRTKDAMAEEARHSKIAGTPRFMAPEQARGSAATKSSDIYSLGATLYFMLTGRGPVESAPDMRVQLQYVREGKVVPITTLLPRIDNGLARIVMRSLSLNPNRRPFDMAMFRDELNKALLGQAEGSRHWLIEFYRSHSRTILAFTGIVIGTAVGFAVGLELRPSNENLEQVKLHGQILLQEAETRVGVLTQILEVDPEMGEIRSVRDELQKAIESKSVDRLAELLPPSQRFADRWESRHFLTILANHHDPAVSSVAREQLVRLPIANIHEEKLIMNEARRLWYQSLGASKKTPDSPTAVPVPPSQDLLQKEPHSPQQPAIGGKAQ